jgi:hypothetical protein
MFFIFIVSLVTIILVIELDRLYERRNTLYTEGASKLRYIKNTSKGVYIENTCGRMYTRSRNKIIYIEFAGCHCLVLLISENRLIYIPLKINAG